MNNGNCSSNCLGFGNNSIMWILIILLLMPGLFNGCGCNNNSDWFIIIILLLFFTGGSNIFGTSC